MSNYEEWCGVNMWERGCGVGEEREDGRVVYMYR